MAFSGGGGTFFKQELVRGEYNFHLKIFFGGPVLKHYTFLKTTHPPPPPWDLIKGKAAKLH